MEDNFYVWLPSDSSHLYYKNNTLSKFTTHLTQAIDLSREKWEVGLAEITYPCGGGATSGDCEKLSTEELTENVVITRTGEQITFPIREYDGIGDLYKTIKNKIDLLPDKEIIFGEFQYYLLLENTVLRKMSRERVPWMAASIPPNTRVNTVKIPFKDKTKVETFTFQFPVRIYKGLVDLIQTIRNHMSDFQIMIGANAILLELIYMDLQDIYIKRRGDFLSRDTEPVYVYTDIVTPQLVGDVNARVLRIVEYPVADCREVYQPIYYIPVEKPYIQDITIELRDRFGNYFDILSGVRPTIVTLHFRKRCQY